MRRTRTVIIVVTAVFATVISMANIHSVTVKLLVTDINIPLILLILLMLFAGFVCGYILKGIVDYRKDRL